MQVSCQVHGDMEEFTVDGYTIGHHTRQLNARDLEGTEFLVEPVERERLSEDNITIKSGRSYLRKYENVEEQVAEALYDGDAIDLGINCPDCGHPENVELLADGTEN